MRLLLLGKGRMGRLVEGLAGSYGAEVVGVIDRSASDTALDAFSSTNVDVAIDFTLPDAVPQTLPRLAAAGISVVIGTTGWGSHEPALREAAARGGIGVFAASNFSLGLNLFQLIVEQAARSFAAHPAYGAYLHEAHHAAKKDAPSGTAHQLLAAMTAAGYEHRVDVSATRAGHILGVHTVGFDGPADSVTLTHEVRDRAVFARGALDAARWLRGRRGWFTMRDMLTDGARSSATAT